MPTIYLTHPQHGATHSFDNGEVERLEKLGWKVGKEPTGAEILAAKKGAIAARLREELAALEPEAPKAEPVEVVAKAKPGRKPKVKA